MKKLLKKKGFTLAELLIVVAIIAVLVAISIPVFTSQLTKAKEAADEANVRAYYAECVVNMLSDETAYPSSYGGTSLNYSSKLTWTVDATSKDLSVKYEATKIDDLILSAKADSSSN